MNKPDQPRKALGKGIDALMRGRIVSTVASPEASPTHPQELSLNLDINRIDPNPLQARRIFHGERMEELDLFDRRYKIFEQLKTVLAAVTRDANVSAENLLNFRSATIC